MNILVYSGGGVSQTSLDNTLSTLRTLLPHYAVQTVALKALANHPWSTGCSLLVFPPCRDFLAYKSAEAVKSADAVRSFVEDGGAMLGFAMGIEHVYRKLDFGSLSLGTTSLRFSHKPSGGNIQPKFQVDGTQTVRSVTIQLVENGERVDGVADSNRPDFIEINGVGDAKVLARYVDKGKEDAVAAVRCIAGKGKVTVWAPNIENSITAESSSLSAEDARQADRKRLNVVRETLRDLGLQLEAVNSVDPSIVTRPLPQFFIGQPSKPNIVSKIMDSLSLPLPDNEPQVLVDKKDTFHFHRLSENILEEIKKDDKATSEPDTWQPKRIIVCPDGALPFPGQTPLFDTSLFFSELAKAREEITAEAHPWGVGEALCYGEIVTSTQTLLDGNPTFMSSLPPPLLSLASQQLSGRGRGSNLWLSPPGCLQFSLLLRVPSTFPSSKLVFVQYLFGLAVTEACRTDAVLGPYLGDMIRLKWPNDLYAVIGDRPEDRRKIGGILVNTKFSAGDTDIVIGCGLNVLNPPPILSLSQLVPPHSGIELRMERTAAVIMAKFEPLWTDFVKNRGSFGLFMNLYLTRWLHSDQLVTLTTETPHKKVRIVGITRDHGLLRTMPERSGWSDEDYRPIELAPDGNSFDIMANLIKKKT